MVVKPTKVGKEIEKNLSSVNLEPWDHIYENDDKDDTVKELNKDKKKDSSDKIT